MIKMLKLCVNAVFCVGWRGHLNPNYQLLCEFELIYFPKISRCIIEHFIYICTRIAYHGGLKYVTLPFSFVKWHSNIMDHCPIGVFEVKCIRMEILDKTHILTCHPRLTFQYSSTIHICHLILYKTCEDLYWQNHSKSIFDWGVP